MKDSNIVTDFSSMDFKAGELLLLDKPLDWTSFDVVNKVRNEIRRAYDAKIKVGHAGTLDPKATGLLILCTGKKTKTLEQHQGKDKTYIATVKLGATTPCYDTEMEEDAQYPTAHITEDLIAETLQSFVGEIEQEVPIFSAVKVNGVRMYKMARKGEEVERKSRVIWIRNIHLIKVDMPYVSFEVECSKGTYIRSLAHDLGKALNSGGYLTGLQRTKIGDFDLKDAFSVDEFIRGIQGVSILGD